jgi:excisionase family DNA binding protein
MMTIEDVARRWSLTPNTVRTMIRVGALDAARLGGRYRLTWDAVLAAEGGRRPRSVETDRYRAPLLRKSDVARRMRVSIRTVERWIADGMPTRPIGDNVRMSPWEVDRWLRGRFGFGLPEAEA